MKVALYLSGLMTNYQKTYQNLLKNIIEPNDCDIFIVTTPYSEKKLKPIDIEQFKQQIRNLYGERIKVLKVYLPEHHNCKIDKKKWKELRKKINEYFGCGKNEKDKKKNKVNNYIFDIVRKGIWDLKCSECRKRYKFFWNYFNNREIKQKAKNPERFIEWYENLYYSRFLFMKTRTTYSVEIKHLFPFGNGAKSRKTWLRMVGIRETWDNRIHDQYFKLHLVNELRKQYETDNGFKYDAIIRCRPDALFNNPIKVDEYTLNGDIVYIFVGHKWFKLRKNDNKTYNNKLYDKEAYNENPMRFNWNGFAIGNGEVIDKYCQFGQYFGKRYSKDIVKYGYKYGLDPESQLLQYLELDAELKIKSLKKEVKYSIYRKKQTNWENFGASFK